MGKILLGTGGVVIGYTMCEPGVQILPSVLGGILAGLGIFLINDEEGR